MMGWTPAAQADSTARFVRGFYNITTGALMLPLNLLKSTVSNPTPIGLLEGVVGGTINSTARIVGGVFDIGTAVIPYAKYLLFFI